MCRMKPRLPLGGSLNPFSAGFKEFPPWHFCWGVFVLFLDFYGPDVSLIMHEKLFSRSHDWLKQRIEFRRPLDALSCWAINSFFFVCSISRSLRGIWIGFGLFDRRVAVLFSEMQETFKFHMTFKWPDYFVLHYSNGHANDTWHFNRCVDAVNGIREPDDGHSFMKQSI